MNKFAQAFDDMSKTIEHNPEEAFGGAFVVVLPADKGQPLKVLKSMFTDIKDPVVLLSVAKSLIDEAVRELESNARNPFGR